MVVNGFLLPMNPINPADPADPGKLSGPDDEKGAVDAYYERGAIAAERGDLAEAERCYEKALVISERLGDGRGMALAYHQLGHLALERGDWTGA